MSAKLLTEHHLEFLSLKGGCTGSSESTFVKTTLLEITCRGSIMSCVRARTLSIYKPDVQISEVVGNEESF